MPFASRAASAAYGASLTGAPSTIDLEATGDTPSHISRPSLVKLAS